MATINKDGTPRKQRHDIGVERGRYKVRNRKRTRIAKINLAEPIGQQLRAYRDYQNVSLQVMAGLIGWSPKSGPANLYKLETGTGRFSVDKELSAINTIIKYLRALEVKEVTFIL